MKIRHKNIVLFTLLITLSVHGQEKKAEKAQEIFNNFNYATAIRTYEDLIEKGYTSEEVFKNLGDANYRNANYKEASNWYSKLFEIKNTTIGPEYVFRYAQTLKSLQDYDGSILWMEKLATQSPNDLRAIKFRLQENSLEKINNNSGRYAIKNLSINSKESDFSPTFYKKELVFSSARDSGFFTKKIHLWNNKWFLNLYKTSIHEDGTYSSPSKFSKGINKKSHESSPVFTADGNTMYFTRNNFINGSFTKDDKGISRLKIYKATLENNVWTEGVELPFNSDVFSCAHPALNANETKLFFASNMQGTYGESDIFYVDITTNGAYGKPINLGTSVNTEARETFPFISSKNILYFASDGQPGLGGLDVFGIDLEQRSQSQALNLGKPLNSIEDDFSYIINEETKKGYFTSNRKGGYGDDDIYAFVERKPLNFKCIDNFTAVVKNRNTKEVIVGANLTLINKVGETIATGISDGNGNVALALNCQEEEYTLVSKKMNYNEEKKLFSFRDIKNKKNVAIFMASSIEKVEQGADLAKKMDLEKIYFDFDKSFIRKDAKVILMKVVAYLKQYPTTKIHIGSHTDSRGKESYNQELSNRRAKATLYYLITQGIKTSRLSAEGFGEIKLINNCNSASKCSEDAHQLNRRSEFITIN